MKEKVFPRYGFENEVRDYVSRPVGSAAGDGGQIFTTTDLVRGKGYIHAGKQHYDQREKEEFIH
jgi:hypothetical protein